MLVYGTQDTDAPEITSILLSTELTVLGKEFEFKRIPGADHSYNIKGVSYMENTMLEALNWALK